VMPYFQDKALGFYQEFSLNMLVPQRLAGPRTAVFVVAPHFQLAME